MLDRQLVWHARPAHTRPLLLLVLAISVLLEPLTRRQERLSALSAMLELTLP